MMAVPDKILANRRKDNEIGTARSLIILIGAQIGHGSHNPLSTPDITDAYGDVNNFANNFAGSTKAFAEKLITEMVDFNNGIADIGDTEGGLENYDNDKLNNWVNQLMGDIVETNESFNTLVNE